MGLAHFAKQVLFRTAPNTVIKAGTAISEGRRSEVKIIRALAPRSSTALDIGASFGLYTYILAKHAAKVEAFEPNPQKAAYLRSLSLPNCDIYEVALSHHSGQADLVVPLKETACATIEPEHPLANDHGEGLTRIAVTLRSLDDFEFENVGFAKIDVEGHELSVLRGGLRLLRRDQPILFVEIERRHNPLGFQQIFPFLADLGYRAYSCSHRSISAIRNFDVAKDQSPDDLPAGIKKGTYVYNFLFIPNNNETTLDELREADFEIVL